MRRGCVLALVVLGACAAPQARTATLAQHTTDAATPAGPAWPASKPRTKPEVYEIDEARGLSRVVDIPRGRVVVTTTSCGFTILEPLHFHAQSTHLTPALQTTVEELAKTVLHLQKDQIVEFELVGHADFAERDPDGVAAARARTVAAALFARGVRGMVTVRGAGAAQPLTRDRTVDRAKNRRVEILIVRRADKP